MGLNLYKSLSEESMIAGCRSGNPRVQQQLYERYSPVMLPVCLRYVKSKDLAEDIMVSGFMKVFDKIDSYKGTGSLQAWIRKIMVNQALGHLRKHKSMHLHVNSELVEYLPDLAVYSDQLEAQDLLNLVCELPLGYRTVFNLYAIEGYSHKEVAELLGISENTSKSQLSRARGLLQQQILKEQESLKTKITNNE